MLIKSAFKEIIVYLVRTKSNSSSGLKQDKLKKPEHKTFYSTSKESKFSETSIPFNYLLFEMKESGELFSYICGKVAVTSTSCLPPSLISLLISLGSNIWE